MFPGWGHAPPLHVNAIIYYLLLRSDQQEIVFLSPLHEEIFSVEQVISRDYLVESCQFLLIDRDAASLHEFSHLAF